MLFDVYARAAERSYLMSVCRTLYFTWQFNDFILRARDLPHHHISSVQSSSAVNGMNMWLMQHKSWIDLWQPHQSAEAERKRTRTRRTTHSKRKLKRRKHLIETHNWWVNVHVNIESPKLSSSLWFHPEFANAHRSLRVIYVNNTN